MIFLLLWYMLSHSYIIDIGYVGVEVNTSSMENSDPLFMMTTGYTDPDTIIVEYPMSIQSVIWTDNSVSGANEQISFTTADFIDLRTDLLVRYQLDPEKASTFYRVFQEKDMNKFAHGFLRNIAQRKFAEDTYQYTASEITSNQVLQTLILRDVLDSLQSEVRPYGVQIVQMSFIGPVYFHQGK